MQPELGSLLGEILFIKISEGKLEEINISTQVTKNFNTSYYAGSHLFFLLSRWIHISAIGSFEVGSWNIYMSFSEKQYALFSGGGVGHNEIS